MIDYKIIGKRIQKARNAAGLTQEALSEKIGISANYLSKVEGGHERPNLELLGKISATADVSLPELLTGVVRNGGICIKNSLTFSRPVLPKRNG